MDVIRRLIEWSERREAVRAAILTSTRASRRAPVDRFSDYDVVLVVEDIRPFYESRAWLEDFGRVLVLYRDPFYRDLGGERFAYITQYEDGTKIDFILQPVEWLRQAAALPQLPADLDLGYAILLDKDRLAQRLPLPTYTAFIPAPPSGAEYLELVEEFLHETTYVAKHLWRDDLLPAKYSLDQVMKQNCLRRMLEWRAEIDHGWSLKPGAYGKGLKERLDPEIWSQLERTYVGAGLEENWEALFGSLALFRQVARQVGERLGYEYPEELHRRVAAYLQRVRTLQ